jgi:membrane protein YqaA with SNARE-associated domain
MSQPDLNNVASNEDFKKEFKKNMLGLAVTLIVLFGVFAGITFLFKDPIQHLVDVVVAQAGFVGMCVISFFSGIIVTPVPQEAFIFMIQKSNLNENWIFYVFVFGVVSCLAGQVCWFLGGKVGHARWVQKMLGKHREKVGELVQRYGFWGFLIGVISPLPFSVVCWTAGIFELRWATFTLGSLFRILRFFVMYFLLKMT